jgi:hypothetical protein
MKHTTYWQASSRSITQTMLRLLWNPKVHYSVHNSLPQACTESDVFPSDLFPSRFHTKIL